FPVMIESGISRDMKHPRLETALGAESGAVFQHPKENVLDEVFGKASIARHPDKEIEKSAMMPVEKHRKFGNIAVPHRQHQVFILLDHFQFRKLSGCEKVTRE